MKNAEVNKTKNESLTKTDANNDKQYHFSLREIKEICEKATDNLIASGWRQIEWIEVEKELPENDGECLAVIVDEISCAWYGFCHFDKSNKEFTLLNKMDSGNVIKPTHWMYLPEPPKID